MSRHKVTKPRIIGLTGGIATGKSTVTTYLAQRYQLPILDADVYAREAIAPPSAILTQIFARYGVGIQNADGSLNRQALGDIVFNDPDEKLWLETQIHPYVRQRFHEALATIQETQATVICAIPLLFEAQLTDFVTEIWVVACTPEQQLARLQRRNQLSVAQAQARIASQMPLTEKVQRADVVLDNSLDLATLYHQVDRALKGSC
ncbi:dephospho-CoA kinase [Picosynechococcus sp. PCC 7003]|uniref:dephospho-CoA kinase n=1 Tax=Picosynechococcus sp. PCC 7003 TaxID=374981 RepID=UPI000810A371|nr:dephospho-CoA kinase [Picosynechococcus sp. PCC 7003]ANV85326.1 dephospho-CoA kinase [Picosynechococcus sp. PCC 7003]